MIGGTVPPIDIKRGKGGKSRISLGKPGTDPKSLKEKKM